MKFPAIIIVLLFAAMGGFAQTPNTSSHAAKKMFNNPLPVKLGDPFILPDNGVYYLYGTGSRNGFPGYKSTDLVLLRWKVTDLQKLQAGREVKQKI